ncbi:MAG: hypothetical protein ACK5WZ_00495 [Pseudobdellovibrionaceae bacterium]
MFLKVVTAVLVLMTCSLGFSKDTKGKTVRKISNQESVPSNILEIIRNKAKESNRIKNAFQAYAPNVVFDEKKIQCQIHNAYSMDTGKVRPAVLCSISVGQRPFEVCKEQGEYDECIQFEDKPVFEEAFFHFRAETNGRIPTRYKPVGDNTSDKLYGNPAWCVLFNTCAA